MLSDDRKRYEPRVLLFWSLMMTAAAAHDACKNGHAIRWPVVVVAHQVHVSK